MTEHHAPNKLEFENNNSPGITLNNEKNKIGGLHITIPNEFIPKIGIEFETKENSRVNLQK